MSKKVLIVEDEYIVAKDLQLILEQAGYTVNGIAASAMEAEENIRSHKPDLVLLDIRLEGKLTGIDLARKLKAENIAFVYLSANSNQKILEEAKTTEPYGFLVKPFRKKDLLIALDIAWYLHNHSFESKLRQEQILQQQLTELSNETLDAEQKLLKVARVIQSYIPFDLIVSGFRPLNTAQFNDKGYLRIGYDEYQLIGKKELLTITGLKENDFSAIIESNSTHAAAIYNEGVTNDKPGITSLLKILFNTFHLQSYLVFPIVLSNGMTIQYFFYSRQRDIYTKDHLDLLKRLKTCLTELTESMMYPKASSIPVMSEPGFASGGSSEHKKNTVFESIIGNHHLLLTALDLVAQAAPHNTSILILGESGTGKEKVAQSIHDLSPRKNGPFIKVNCAAIPPTLMESELFGHEKGAFTDAIEKRKGRFEQADGGTIFLDEIGELPLGMQVKLLRVLQEKEIEPVGGSSPKKVNVRIVAATNRNLEKEVAERKFRLDLYYRLNVFPITLPALRERKSDIEALALFFAKKFCQEFSRPFPGIAETMMKELIAYDWPGNIRELENILEQSVILNDGKSKLELKRRLSSPTELAGRANINNLEDVKHIQRETEREYIISILKKAKGRVRGRNGAAELINLKPTTLEAKMARLSIKKEDFIDSTENP